MAYQVMPQALGGNPAEMPPTVFSSNLIRAPFLWGPNC